MTWVFQVGLLQTFGWTLLGVAEEFDSWRFAVAALMAFIWSAAVLVDR